MKPIRAIAKIHITVEVDAGQPWGEDCSIGQLYHQAAESGKNNLLNALSLGSKQLAPITVRIVGEPKVIGIVTQENP